MEAGVKLVVRGLSRIGAFILIAALASASSAHAQPAYPAHQVRIIVPFPPGGPADALARMAGDRLAQAFDQPFVVENKPGAGGNIGMELGAKRRRTATR